MSDISDFNVLGRDGDENMPDEIAENIYKQIRSFISSSNDNFIENYECENNRITHVNIIIEKILYIKTCASQMFITKKTYRRLREELLDLLAGYFGSHEDLKRLEETVSTLEQHEICPPNYYDSFLTRTPLGRWM